MRKSDPKKRRRILDAATTLFVERHYHEVRMDDIAKKAGVAKGTLYLHFGNKENLYVCLALDFMDKLIEQLAQQASRLETLEAKLLAMVRTAREFTTGRGYLLDLFQRAESLCLPDQAEAFLKCRTRLLEIVSSFVGPNWTPSGRRGRRAKPLRFVDHRHGPRGDPALAPALARRPTRTDGQAFPQSETGLTACL